MHVLICGGGVIGASIAYFLSLHGVKATVIERAGVAGAASGKAGGFLALNWCDGSPLGPLARHSFALHARLAEEIDRDWGYRRLPAYGGSASGRWRRRVGTGFGLDWLAPEVTVDQRRGSPETTAQVPSAQGRSSAKSAPAVPLRLSGKPFRQEIHKAAHLCRELPAMRINDRKILFDRSVIGQQS
jgi:glycine/D-amino acid oxidase-like deaminating enzyme